MRTFVFLRKTAFQHSEICQKINNLEEKYDDQFKEVFSALKLLLEPPMKSKKKSDSNREKKRSKLNGGNFGAFFFIWVARF
jgi:hypothetical protein